MLYEKRILNGEPIVVVFKKEGGKDARENEINLSDNFDSLRFGRTIMKKFKSKARRIDGSIAKHYFGFKLPN